MSYAAGLLPASALTKIQADGAQLYAPTARAWKRMQAAAKKELGRSIASAGRWGSYRADWVQHAMHLAGAGSSAAAKLKWNLNPNSRVSIADHPYGTHEHGTRVDIVGTVMDSRFLALAARFGFTREFGAKDPNHFEHDGKTATAFSLPSVTKKVYYTVRSGDTMSEIAALYSDPRDKKADLTVAQLLMLNPSVKDANLIRVGQKLRVA